METEFKTSMKSTVKNQVNKNKEEKKRKTINKGCTELFKKFK